MNPKTGDILALASKPDYDPNDSRTPIYPYYQEELEKYNDKDKIKRILSNVEKSGSK